MSAASRLVHLRLAGPVSRQLKLALAGMFVAAYLPAVMMVASGAGTPAVAGRFVWAHTGRGGGVIGLGWSEIFTTFPVAFSTLVAVLCIIKQFDPIRKRTWLTLLWLFPAIGFAAWPSVYTLALAAGGNLAGIFYVILSVENADDWMENTGGDYEGVAKRTQTDIQELRRQHLSLARNSGRSFKSRPVD